MKALTAVVSLVCLTSSTLAHAEKLVPGPNGEVYPYCMVFDCTKPADVDETEDLVAELQSEYFALSPQMADIDLLTEALQGDLRNLEMHVTEVPLGWAGELRFEAQLFNGLDLMVVIFQDGYETTPPSPLTWDQRTRRVQDEMIDELINTLSELAILKQGLTSPDDIPVFSDSICTALPWDAEQNTPEEEVCWPILPAINNDDVLAMYDKFMRSLPRPEEGQPHRHDTNQPNGVRPGIQDQKRRHAMTSRAG